MSDSKAIAQKRLRDFYAMTPDAPIYKQADWYYVLDRWTEEGHLLARDQVSDYDAYLREVFNFDEQATFDLWGLGWCEGALWPCFEEKVLEDRGDYELVQDAIGRSVLFFKGRRNGFMPEYVGHPVKDMKSWEENVKWRLDPAAHGRMDYARQLSLQAKEAKEKGDLAVQRCAGGYMYLRSLMGPEDLLYAFYDQPELIHSCMQTWLTLAEAVTSEHQKNVFIDELFMSEDICYNHGSLISHDMMREFLLPYYQQLIDGLKRRNGGHPFHIQIDTDGRATDVIDVYREIGMDNMSPFEVASGCDVVSIAKKYPDLRIIGGIDKRIISAGGDKLKFHIDSIMPYMRRRGGYIPTCDHGVPEETSFENYMLYRSLISEYSE